MKTTRQLIFKHDSRTGQFNIFNNEELKMYETLIVVPKGTKVSNQTAIGIDENYHFVDDFKFAERYYHHDLTYHGINIPKEFVEK